MADTLQISDRAIELIHAVLRSRSRGADYSAPAFDEITDSILALHAYIADLEQHSPDTPENAE